VIEFFCFVFAVYIAIKEKPKEKTKERERDRQRRRMITKLKEISVMYTSGLCPEKESRSKCSASFPRSSGLTISAIRDYDPYLQLHSPQRRCRSSDSSPKESTY
jgi:hypothetical protein